MARRQNGKKELASLPCIERRWQWFSAVAFCRTRTFIVEIKFGGKVDSWKGGLNNWRLMIEEWILELEWDFNGREHAVRRSRPLLFTLSAFNPSQFLDLRFIIREVRDCFVPRNYTGRKIYAFIPSWWPVDRHKISSKERFCYLSFEEGNFLLLDLVKKVPKVGDSPAPPLLGGGEEQVGGVRAI